MVVLTYEITSFFDPRSVKRLRMYFSIVSNWIALKAVRLDSLKNWIALNL